MKDYTLQKIKPSKEKLNTKLLTECKSSHHESEDAFRRLAQDNGWKICHQGWPDFICWKGKKIIIVEVKGYQEERLRKEQELIINFLASHGIECYRWNPKRSRAKSKPIEHLPIVTEEQIEKMHKSPAKLIRAKLADYGHNK